VIQRAGRTHFALQSGELVNHVDEHRFEVITTGESLTRTK
jgi:hypothetical protein